jgi:hypothetical protein
MAPQSFGQTYQKSKGVPRGTTRRVTHGTSVHILTFQVDQSKFNMWHDCIGTSGPVRDHHVTVSHWPNMAKVG